MTSQLPKNVIIPSSPETVSDLPAGRNYALDREAVPGGSKAPYTVARGWEPYASGGCRVSEALMCENKNARKQEGGESGAHHRSQCCGPAMRILPLPMPLRSSSQKAPGSRLREHSMGESSRCIGRGGSRTQQTPRASSCPPRPPPFPLDSGRASPTRISGRRAQRTPCCPSPSRRRQGRYCP